MLLPKLPLLRHIIFAIHCPDPAAGGVRPPAVRTTAQPYTAGRLPLFATAVRKSASEVPLRFIDALRYAPGIVRSQPRTASLLSGNSVLRTNFIRKRAGRLRRGRNTERAPLWNAALFDGTLGSGYLGPGPPAGGPPAGGPPAGGPPAGLPPRPPNMPLPPPMVPKRQVRDTIT